MNFIKEIKRLEELKKIINDELKNPNATFESVMEIVNKKMNLENESNGVKTHFDTFFNEILNKAFSKAFFGDKDPINNSKASEIVPNLYSVVETDFEAEGHSYSIKFYIPGIKKDTLKLKLNKQKLILKSTENTDLDLSIDIPVNAIIHTSVYDSGVLTVKINLEKEKEISIL